MGVIKDILRTMDYGPSPEGSEHVKAIGPDGNLVAIGRIALPHVYHPVVVMN